MSLLVTYRFQVNAGSEADFERSYPAIWQLAAGVQGHLGERLLRHLGAPGLYTIVSEWESEAAFRAWLAAPVHAAVVDILQRFRAGQAEIDRLDILETFDRERRAEQKQSAQHPVNAQ